MKHILILIICFATSIATFSQAQLDLDEIKKLAEDSTSSSNYRALVEEFNHNPLALDTTRGRLIYYGNLFRGYDLYKINFEEINFTELVLKKKYKQAIPKGEDLLKSDPVNLEILSKLLTCYNKANIKDKAELTKAKVDLLVTSILTHGDGLSESKTLKVISVGDEYAMMGMLGITGMSRNSKLSTKSAFDTWKAKNSKGKRIDFYVEVLFNLQAASKSD
jgi:hypothetical protein